ncbi:hypothetical protein D9V32_05435 [Mycetocola tolaasinivorans]|uniref:Uncharacterized protein n=1 Tax=Mycetocola tolaasinivorans TaxID=76635 RepID=A0A3L7AAS8_9MICO|nr:hypothetical protein [Mycetocola tolaasinivorans]RLP77064.1 hypothetical protein D9V32_05435 [Mycetocola tolaasinivorans]
MKNFLIFLAGIAAGFVVAHEVNKTTRGRRFFTELDGRMREFGDIVADSYKLREAELREDSDVSTTTK